MLVLSSSSSKSYSKSLRMSFIITVLLAACLLSVAVVFSKETGFAHSRHQSNQQQDGQQQQQLHSHNQNHSRNLAQSSSLEQCKENMVEAASQYDFMFSKEAFLDFISLQSNGAMANAAFDTLAVGLVFDFSILTCTVKQGGCTNDEPAAVFDILNYQGPNNDNDQEGSTSNDLVADFCSRINDKLSELITPGPTQIPSTMPSLLPSSSPTIHPTSRPTSSPSAGPTAHPSWHPSSRPTSSPSAAPVSSPSSRPSTYPSLIPTLSRGPTFHPSTSPTLSSRPTARPTASPTRLHEPSDSPTMHPTLSPTNLDSFTLTFSVGYNVSNPEELMVQWTEGVAYQVLETFDSNCTRDSNTALACPLTLDVTVFLNVRPCSSFGTPFEANTCALADLTVSLSSKDPFDGGILTAINRSVRDRIDELADIL